MKRLIALLTVTALMLALTAMPALAQTQQRGLVNVDVDVTDNVVIVQVPIAVAANVCDVSVNVLAQQLKNGPTTCEAVAENNL